MVSDTMVPRVGAQPGAQQRAALQREGTAGPWGDRGQPVGIGQDCSAPRQPGARACPASAAHACVQPARPGRQQAPAARTPRPAARAPLAAPRTLWAINALQQRLVNPDAQARGRGQLGGDFQLSQGTRGARGTCTQRPGKSNPKAARKAGGVHIFLHQTRSVRSPPQAPAPGELGSVSEHGCQPHKLTQQQPPSHYAENRWGRTGEVHSA